MEKPVQVLILLILAFISVSCNKSSTDNFAEQDDPKNHSAKLIGNWKLTAQVSDSLYDWNGDGTTETDVYATYSSCGKNQGFVFDAGGTGSRKFPCQDPRPLTWKVVNNSDSIVTNVSYDNGQTFLYAGKFPLLEVTNSRLVIKYKLAWNQMEPLVVTDTYQKQ